MIRETEVIRIGKLAKTHGLRGEIAFRFENDIFDRVECPYLVLKVDGIFVPFFMIEYRFKGSETALLTFENVDNEEKASKLQGLEVYFPKEYYDEATQEEDAALSWNFFIGFSAIDKEAGALGTITGVDEETINTLFLIESDDGNEIIVPAVEDLIESIDNENKVIHFILPEGLVE